MTDTTILVVDDEKYNLLFITEHLAEAPYRLVTASDGAEAWALLEHGPEDFDAVLLDRIMPRMDGMEVLARMKAHPVLKTVPVILQTAVAEERQVIEGLRAGAHYYLTKPFRAEMLRSVLETALGDRRRYRDLQAQVRERTRGLGLMRSGAFQFRTLEESRDLATFLANACPHPSRVVTGLSELLVNAVEHGNLGISYADKSRLNDAGTWRQEVERRLALPEYADKRVDVHYARRNGRVRLTIRDQGAGFDWQQYLQIEPARAFDTHGRGIAMARALSFDTLEYRGTGNEVVVTVARQPRPVDR